MYSIISKIRSNDLKNIEQDDFINIKIIYIMKNYLILLCCSALFSCSSELSESPRELSLEEKLAKAKLEDFCRTIEPVSNKEKAENNTARVSFKRSYWDIGETVKIKFLNGDKYFQDLVKKYANEWTKYANLKFVWVASNEDADIKIAFKWNGDDGSWSKVGKWCIKVPQDQPSMNFGSLEKSRYDDIDSSRARVILHEFGHAIGLAHEHQHPLNNFRWDLDFAYYYYKEVYGYDKEIVDADFIDKYSVTEVDYGEFDKKSIMMYGIPSGLILDYISFSRNYVLSNGDKNVARLIYPK